ncbi:MAG: hypothetical protein AB7F32_01875 [Victivallaceae bacterium]
MNFETAHTLFKRYGAELVIFAVTAALFGFCALGDFEPHYDGEMLKPAADVAAGKILFRDTFSRHGFLTVFFQAFAIKLGGATLWTVRVSAVCFYALSAVLLYQIWARALRQYRWAVIALFWLLPAFHMPQWTFLVWSPVYALFFLLLSIAWMQKSLDFERKIDYYLIGASSICAFWCRPSFGSVFAAAALFALALHWRDGESWRATGRRLLRLGIGAAAFSALIAGYLVFADAWRDWVTQAILFEFRSGGEDVTGVAAGGLWPAGILSGLFPGGTFYLLFPLFTLGFALRGGWRVYRGKARPADWVLLAVALPALASWHQYYPAGSPRHWFWAAIPMFGFAVLGVRELPRPVWRWGAAAVLLLLLLPELTPRMKGFCDSVAGFDSRREVANIPVLRHLRLSGGQYQYWNNIRKAFDAVPDEFRGRPYVNLTDAGLYCFFFPGDWSFHPMYMNWQRRVYNDYPDRLREFVARENPVLVYLSDRDPDPGRRFARVSGASTDLSLYILLPRPKEKP